LLCINLNERPTSPIQQQQQPVVTIQRRFQSPNKRRQRNLTTSLVSHSAAFTKPQTQPTANALLRHHSRDDYLDKFLDSLEDINQYLERKLQITALPESTDIEIKKINENSSRP